MLATSEHSWYAVRVKSNREWVTSDALRGKGYEVLLPSYRDPGIRRTAARHIERPLFPGYIFCRFDVNDRLPVMVIPGVVHIVGTGRKPEPVDPVEMTGVLTLLQSRLELSPFEYPPVGEQVQIQTGPLRGVVGTVLAHKGAERLVISVSLLQRSIAVNVDRDWVVYTPEMAICQGANRGE